MTYCLAACVDAGLVFVSDSRTNAGIDRLGTHSKMHTFTDLPGRFFTLLSAGNLATTQAVVARLERDIREGAATSLATVQRMREAADYIGRLNRSITEKYASDDAEDGFSPSADFLFGGQINDQGQETPHALFLVYAQGNYISPPAVAPFLQLGEQKYGRPILDRIVRADAGLDTVALCGLVSMDSTMRSNATVGPPIEAMLYDPLKPEAPRHLVYRDGDPYLQNVRERWAVNLRRAFDDLPPLAMSQSQSE